MASGEENRRFGERLADFADRFEEKAHSASRKMESGEGGFQKVLRHLRELFTRDVTREGFREMFRRDSRDTFRYFTRDIDFLEMRKMPPHVRYPRIFWEVFTSLAYRLSPPRRIAFVIAGFAFLLGLIQSVSFRVIVAQNGEVRVQGGTGMGWWFLSSVLLLFLLVLELRDKLDLKGDLTIAREIQYGLVPSEPFHQNDFHIFSRMRTANTVGGDYYDLIPLEEPGKIAVLMGDVAGKGMPAALLMALLQGSVRTLVTAGDRGTSLVTKLNRYLCEIMPENRLITLFYGELNTLTGDFHYVNAGHNPPLLRRNNGALEWLSTTGLLLGVIREAEMGEGTICLEAGDQLLLYTDGVTEAANEKDEQFGSQRLAEFFQRNFAQPQDRLLDQLLKEVVGFCHQVRPTDDMTLMSLRRG
jgi:hypothetical protein